MIKITLWDALEWDNIGLLIPAKSGFVYTNQVGGTMCAHPELEGIYVPLPFAYEHQGCPMYDRYEGGDYSPVLVQQFLEFHEMGDLFTSEGVSEDVRGTLAEAWVPVRVLPTDDVTLAPFANWSGIIVYGNSD